MSIRQIMKTVAVCGAAISLLAGNAFASKLVPQTPLAGKSIPKYVEPLPVFGPASGGAAPRVAGNNLTVSMEEFQQQVLPAPNPALGIAGFPLTTVWGYKIIDNAASATFGPHYPAFTIEAQRNTPKTVKYVNNLVNPVLQQYLTVDQTLHWADPTNLMCSTMAVNCVLTPTDPCCQPYTGAVPAVVHLHGGEVPSAFDGGPDTWFTPGLATTGPSFVTDTYTYPNGQEPTTLFFHDHTMGATRLNLYAGLVGFYLIRDAAVEAANLPSGPYEIEMAIQDKAFDTNGQLLFPDGFPAGLNGPPTNPDIHPFWNPEFFGDVILVNGKSWPFLNVEPRRYRLRLVNGSNARFFTLSFQTIKGNGVPGLFQIGTDGGYLNAPLKLSQLTIAPGERADVIVDFTGVKQGAQFILKNSAKAPFPAGAAPDPATTGEIMKFMVALTGPADTSCNPAIAGNCVLRPVPIVDLKPTVTPGVTPVRRLTLNEVASATGPIEVLLNNSKYDGASSVNAGGVTELPRVGDTEVWEIINTTADTHPIHIHLVQFQIISRQTYATTKYTKVYNAAFGNVNSAPLPAGCVAGAFCPGYGPPLSYNTPVAGAIGGNPDVTPFLINGPRPPDTNELGWKDTFRMNPGEVTRVVARWAPQDTPVGGVLAGTNLFPFDPTTGPGYVWHCHIVDHEDNEMMRPYTVAP